jgi:repressor LexA
MTVHHHLVGLEKDGYIERGEAPSRKRRPVRLTEKGWEAAGHAPLLGRTAAGRGLEAVAYGDEAYSLTAELLSSRSGRRRYLLRVVGQSMTDARIEDGDLLVVEEDEDPPDGAVVVALLRGEEATVKRLRREGETVRLRSQNGGYEDIVVPAGDVKIQGRVVYVVHPPGTPKS